MVVILLALDVPLALVTFLTFPLLAIGSVIFRIASAGAYRLTREKIAEHHRLPPGDALRGAGGAHASAARSATSRG